MIFCLSLLVLLKILAMQSKDANVPKEWFEIVIEPGEGKNLENKKING